MRPLVTSDILMAFNRIHKTIFALAAVIGPLYWLTMTSDGQRRVDSTLLSLTGKPAIDFNLKAVDGRLTETELKKVFPDQEWLCTDQPSAFGQRLCASQIGTFNGLPARYLTLFFADGQASGLKLAYRGIYHDQLIQQLIQQLGQPQMDAPGTAPAEAVLRWRTDHGMVILKQQLLEDEEAALLWVAGMKLPS